MFSSRRLFPWVSLLVLALLAWWMIDERPDYRPPPDRAPQDTDYYAENFSLMSSDAAGRWSYRLEAANMLHFPASEHWEFLAPRIEFYTERGANWYGVAEHGRAWSEGEEVLLQGEVRLWRPASAVNPATQLDTAEVYLRPTEQYAQTEQPALLRQETSRVAAVGFRAWLGEERIELLSRVRAHYEAQPR